MDSDGEEIFEDATQDLPILCEMNLGTSIEESKLGMSLFLNNQFDEARTLMKPWAEQSMYHALGTGTFYFLEAMMTFERQHILLAGEALDKSMEVCQRFRKKNSIYESLGKLIRRPKYDSLCEEEIHAELCYAECLLLRGTLMFIEDETLISFVRGGLKMRSCLNAFKECWSILKYRRWDDSNSKYKIHFESGVRMGMGGYNLLLSMVPARIMKLLEFLVLVDNRDEIKATGLQQFSIGSQLDGSVRQILCAMALVGYHLFVSYVMGHGEGDLELSEKLITEQLSMFPDGVWYNLAKGRLEFVKSNMDDSIEWYTKALRSQNEWIAIHHLCYWELMWVHSFKCNWDSAIKFSGLLLTESKWSPAVYGYMKAVFMCMKIDQLGNDEKQELSQLFTNIPKWKQRIAGKSIPIEKFAVRKSERYFAQGEKLILPAIELFYLWNQFKIIGKQIELIQPLVLIIEKNIKAIEADQNDFYYTDNLCLLLLLKGMCYKYMKCTIQAEETFREVISCAKKLVVDTYLAPFTTYELGMILWGQGKLEMALTTLEEANHNYKGYSLESKLHFLTHSALAELRNILNNDLESSEIVKIPNGKH